MTKSKQIAILLAAKKRTLGLWPANFCIADGMLIAACTSYAWSLFRFDKDGLYCDCPSNWVSDNWPTKELVAAVFDNSIFNIKYGHAPWEKTK